MIIRAVVKITLLICVVASLTAFYKEPITTRENTLFKVRLSQQAGSSYEWTFVKTKENQHYIKLLSTDFESNNPEKLSTSGKRIFTFKALKHGRIQIKFVKKQSWAEKVVDQATIKLHIKRGR